MMSKPAFAAVACGVFAAILLGVCVHDVYAVAGKVQSYAADGTHAPGVSDLLSILGTLLGGSGFSVAGIAAAVIAFLQRKTPAIVDQVLPNVSDGVKTKVVDVAQITAIQGALAIVKDAATRASLISAGRSAFDDLRDRTFPIPVQDGEAVAL